MQAKQSAFLIRVIQVLKLKSSKQHSVDMKDGTVSDCCISDHSHYLEVMECKRSEDIGALMSLLKQMLKVNLKNQIIPAEALNYTFTTVKHLTKY